MSKLDKSPIVTFSFVTGVVMLRRQDDFSYSPGKLAKKPCVSSGRFHYVITPQRTVKNYLDKTGLIKQCYRDGWWRIKNRVAIKFVSGACDRTR